MPVASRSALDDLVGAERLHEADGVAEAQTIRTLGLGGLGVLDQEAELRARRILGVDGDVDPRLLGERDALADRP